MYACASPANLISYKGKKENGKRKDLISFHSPLLENSSREGREEEGKHPPRLPAPGFANAQNAMLMLMLMSVSINDIVCVRVWRKKKETRKRP